MNNKEIVVVCGHCYYEKIITQKGLVSFDFPEKYQIMFDWITAP